MGSTSLPRTGDSVYSNPGIKTLVGDWDVNPNGYLSYENPDSSRFDLLDSNYNIVDHYTAANGYETDPHEFTKYVNGHVLMIADETQNYGPHRLQSLIQ